MTKTIIIGQPEEAKKELKKIEFVKFFNKTSSVLETPESFPRNWKNIELIQKNHFTQDIMFAYDDNRESGTLYLGHWNDGVV